MTSPPTTGWRFTVNIPQWIHGKDDEGQDVVLYRVNVLLQHPSTPPQGTRPPFFVLRRYNQFRYLYDQLRLALPDVMSDRSLAPPPKHALHIKGSKEMCDRRRADLEAWMWKLIGNPVIARSAALKAFLEWDRALAKAQAAARAAAAQAAASSIQTLEGSQAGPSGFRNSMAGGSDIWELDSEMDARSTYGGDARSEISSYSMATNAAGPGGSGRLQGFANQGRTQPTAAVRSSTGYEGSSSVAAIPEDSADNTAAGATAIKRLGMKLEHRADLRRLVQILEGRLQQASEDMSAATHEISSLKEANRLLNRRVADLGAASQQQPSTTQVTEAAAAHEKELEETRAQLAEARAQLSELQERMSSTNAAETGPARQQPESDSTAAVQQLEETHTQLREAQTAAARAEVEVEQLKDELAASEDIRLELARQLAGSENAVAGKVQFLTNQVSELQQQLQQAQQENAQLLSKLSEWGIASRRASVMGENLSVGSAATTNASASGSAITSPNLSSVNGQLVVPNLSADMAGLQAKLAASEQAQSELKASLETAQGALETEKAGRAADMRKARDNQKLLALEVKKLRGQLATQEQASAERLKESEQQIHALQEELAQYMSRLNEVLQFSSELADAKAALSSGAQKVQHLRQLMKAASGSSGQLSQPPIVLQIQVVSPNELPENSHAYKDESSQTSNHETQPPVMSLKEIDSIQGQPTANGLVESITPSLSRAADQIHVSPQPVATLQNQSTDSVVVSSQVVDLEKHQQLTDHLEQTTQQLHASQETIKLLEARALEYQAQIADLQQQQEELIRNHELQSKNHVQYVEQGTQQDQNSSLNEMDAEPVKAASPSHQPVNLVLQLVADASQQTGQDAMSRQLPEQHQQLVESKDVLQCEHEMVNTVEQEANIITQQLQSELFDVKQHLASVQGQVQQCSQELQACQAELHSCQQELTTATAQLQSQSESHTQLLTACQTELSNCQIELASVQQQLADKTALVDACQAEIVALQAQIAEKSRHAETSQKQLLVYQRELRELQQELGYMITESSHQDDTPPTELKPIEEPLTLARSELNAMKSLFQSFKPVVLKLTIQEAPSESARHASVPQVETQFSVTQQPALAAAVSAPPNLQPQNPTPPTTSDPFAWPPPNANVSINSVTTTLSHSQQQVTGGDDLFDFLDVHSQQAPSTQQQQDVGHTAPRPSQSSAHDDMLLDLDILPSYTQPRQSNAGSNQSMQASSLLTTHPAQQQPFTEDNLFGDLNVNGAPQSSEQTAVWASQLEAALQQASAVVEMLRKGDTTAALRRFEQQLQKAASSMNSKAGQRVGPDAITTAAASADAAMDEFLRLLSDSNTVLDSVTQKVQEFSRTSKREDSHLLLMEPMPEPIHQLHAQLVSVLCELLTLLRQTYSTLNEMRCEKALSEGAATAASINKMANQTSVAKPPIRQPSQTGQALSRPAENQQAPQQPVAPVPGLFAGPGPMSSLFGAPGVPQNTGSVRVPNTQSGVFSRLLGGDTSGNRPDANPAGYVPPSLISDQQGGMDRGNYTAQRTGPQQPTAGNLLQSSTANVFGALGQRVSGAVASWGVGNQQSSDSNQTTQTQHNQHRHS